MQRASILTQVIQFLLHPLQQRQAQLQLLQLLGLLCDQLAVLALKGCHSCSSCRHRCVLMLVPVLPALGPDALLETTREDLKEALGADMPLACRGARGVMATRSSLNSAFTQAATEDPQLTFWILP